MNSEEIKEIGQMFLNISNQNHNMNLGLTDEDIIKGVTNQMEEKLQEFKKNFTQELRDASANVTPRLKRLEGLHEKIEERLNKAIDTSRNWRAEVNDKLHKLDIKETPTVELPPTFLKDKIGELGAKVGGYGGLISSLQRKDGERTDELNKIRKDYRELQDEMWDRFKLIEDWIKSNTSKEKDTLKAEIAENSKEKKGKIILGSSAGFTRIGKVEPKRYIQNQEARMNWDNKDLLELDLSVRSFNALKNHGIKRLAQLITYSPTDLIKIKSFGRKCLREVIDELKKKSLTLNLKKEKADRELRKERIIKQFKL